MAGFKSVYKEMYVPVEGNTSSFLARSTKLKMQQDYLDKAHAMAVKNLKFLEQPVVQDIQTVYKEMESLRLREDEKLYKSVISLLNALKQLKSEVRNEDKLRQLEIDYYRKHVFELEKKIRGLNENSTKSFQKLEEVESALCKDIQMLNNKFNDWSQPINPSLFKPPVRSVSKSYISNTDNMREEVATFQKFLKESGGHNGGWTEEDHLLFLRLRNRYKGKASFLSLLKQHLPDISADDMLLHEDWYQQYENLKNKQKQAIQDWRAEKHKNKEQNSDTKSESSDLNQKIKVESKEDSEEKKKRIEEWKKMLHLKKELEDQKQWEEKQKELELEEKKKERQAAKKIEVERYKEEKFNIQQMRVIDKQMNELRETEERAAQSSILRKAFREQDQFYIARQLNRREQVALKEQQRQTKLVPLRQSVSVDRDPTRLLKPTAAWREHCKIKPKMSTSCVSMPVLHLKNMPHLQVPTWRKGLI